MLTSIPLSMARKVLRTEESPVVATDGLCCVVQQVIQNVSLALFTAVPLSGTLLVRSFYRWTVTVVIYVIFVSSGCGYVQADPSQARNGTIQ